jgi:hypothetical protein
MTRSVRRAKRRSTRYPRLELHTSSKCSRYEPRACPQCWVCTCVVGLQLHAAYYQCRQKRQRRRSRKRKLHHPLIVGLGLEQLDHLQMVNNFSHTITDAARRWARLRSPWVTAECTAFASCPAICISESCSCCVLPFPHAGDHVGDMMQLPCDHVGI